VKKVVKRETKSAISQVIERAEKIKVKKCHSWPMQYDILILYN
jgi:hypothetical protein